MKNASISDLDEFPGSMFSHKNCTANNVKYYLKIEARIFF